jgi:Zn2+/Cd2+-exporting ATPase
MGAAGSDVALDTADVVLMSDDLSKLPFALRLGRRTIANVRQNVATALALKLAFVVLAAAGLATMWMAIVADTGASLLVTANSLRLLREK